MGFKDVEGLYGRPGRYIMMKEQKIKIIAWAYIHLRDWDMVKEIMAKETYNHMGIKTRDIEFVKKHIRITPELFRRLSRPERHRRVRVYMRRHYPEYFGHLWKHRNLSLEDLNSND